MPTKKSVADLPVQEKSKEEKDSKEELKEEAEAETKEPAELVN